MARPPRDFTSARYFHVINRALDSHDLFVIDRDFVLFERSLAEHLVGNGARVHAYALMSNHFHLLVEPAICPDLSQAVGQAQSRYAKAFNRRSLRRGSLFDRRFLAFEADSESEFHRVTRYIHANPIAITGRRGLAAYRWSSLPVYLGRRRAPAWLSTDVLGAEIESATYLGSVLDDEPGLCVASSVNAWMTPVSLDLIIDFVRRRMTDQHDPDGREFRQYVSFFAHEFRAADVVDVAAHFSCSPPTIRRNANRTRDRRRSDDRFASLTDRWMADLRSIARDGEWR